MKMIVDFIKSWFYYPTLCKWFNDNKYGNFKESRFQYAIKHCRMKKKIEEAKKHNYPSDWICQYQQEPVLRDKE
jgi:hypothetical protein